jgi:integrase
MIGKRAKILAQSHVEDLLFFAQHTRHSIRNQVIVLLSLKAGLRAGEIVNLSWAMVVDPTGEIATTLELQDHVAKNGSGRVIPVHPDLREALMQLRADHAGTSGAVIASERGGPMRPIAIVCWFACQSRPSLRRKNVERLFAVSDETAFLALTCRWRSRPQHHKQTPAPEKTTSARHPRNAS